MTSVITRTTRRDLSAIHIIGGLLLTSLTGPAAADVPTLTHLYPAGMQRGASATVTCHGEFPWPIEVWAPGADVKVLDEKGKLEITVPQDLAAERIWIRLIHTDGVSSVVPLLIGSLPETDEVEPNDAPSAAQSLSKFAAPPQDAQVTINGRLQKKGDVDGFGVRLTAGQTLVATVQAHAAFGSPMDSILQIVSPNGTLLAENHDAVGLDPRIVFVAPDKGEYVVRLFAFPSQPGQRIEFHGADNYVYRLTLTTGPAISHAIPMAVSVGETGTCEPDTVEVRGWNIPTRTRLPVTELSLLSDGQLEFEPHRAFPNAHSRVGFVRAPGWSGHARVRLVTDHVVSRIVETSKTVPYAVQLPISLLGRIESRGETDFFRLSLKKDQRVSIAVESLSLDSALVPLVQLKDPEGKTVAERLEKGNAEDVTLTHNAKADGDYLLTVRDRFRHGGERYFYRLTARAPEADFDLSLETDSVVVEAGKESELPVKIKRHQGSGAAIKDIRVSIVGLPEGVEATASLSSSEGKTAAKVTLKIAAASVAFSGQVRIRGVASDSGAVRYARTPAKFDASFDRVWLTVRKDDSSNN